MESVSVAFFVSFECSRTFYFLLLLFKDLSLPPLIKSLGFIMIFPQLHDSHRDFLSANILYGVSEVRKCELSSSCSEQKPTELCFVFEKSWTSSLHYLVWTCTKYRHLKQQRTFIQHLELLWLEYFHFILFSTLEKKLTLFHSFRVLEVIKLHSKLKFRVSVW